MKFLRIGDLGAERPAVLDADGTALDLSGITTDIDAAFLAGGGVDRARAALDAGELTPVDAGTPGTGGTRVGSPVADPGKIIGIGLNYADHAVETGASAPAEPIVFLKAPDSLNGPDDDVLVPRGSTKTDYEVELAVLIGRTARYLDTEADADSVIAGYALANDVSEREFQIERGGQWDKGKSCETFSPLGPLLVTPDEVADPQDLGLRLSVNGEVRQNGSTRDMIFTVRHIVHYLSQFMVLRPGDVIVTGTPAGVAMAKAETPYLKAGDTVELEIDGLGRQRQHMVQA